MERGDPMKLNFEGLEMQKWNIPRDKTQKADKKNGIICLVIVFAHESMAIKLSEVAHFLYFLLMTAKNKSQIGKNL